MKQTYDGQVASSSKYLNISTTKVNLQKSDTITKLGIPQPYPSLELASHHVFKKLLFCRFQKVFWNIWFDSSFGVAVPRNFKSTSEQL